MRVIAIKLRLDRWSACRHTASMATKQPTEIQAALKERLKKLQEDAENPLAKHPLYPLRDELKLMRGKLAMTYEAIVTELKTLGLETDIRAVKTYYKLAGVPKTAKRAKKPAST
jgi:hypothetical protein